jgi:putative ABC transport system permease protein
MHLLESIKMATTTLTANKLRSALTMLGIIIGNASVIAMVGIGQGAQKFTLEKLESFGPNQLIVFTGEGSTEGLSSEAPELVLADADAVTTQAPAVQQVAPLINASYPFVYRDRNIKFSVIGTTPGITYVRSLTIGQGRFFDVAEQQQNAQVIALGSEIAQKLFGQENPVGKVIQVNNLSFQVIGVMRQKGAFLGANPDQVAYIPITTMADQLAGRRSPNGIPIDYFELSARNRDSIRAAAFQVTNILTRKHGKKDFNVVANKSFQDLVEQVTAALSVMLAAIAGISLLVGGIGIMNIMLVSVTERTHEIGLRKAVGATQQDILTQFLIESIILAIAGGVIGSGLGWGGATLMGVLTPFQPTVPISAIMVAMGISGGIGIIFGVVPARQAAQLDPIVALRSA